MQEPKLKINNQRKNSKSSRPASAAFPTIPNKRYFTISEAANLCGVKPHVLRYWEQEFPQLKPNKRRGNRRYYQQQDMLVIREIYQLLYENGFTIVGARARLKQNKALQMLQVETLVAELEGVLQLLQLGA